MSENWRCSYRNKTLLIELAQLAHSCSHISAMPKKRKAAASRAVNFQAATETLSAKWQKSTPADSNLSNSEEERASDDEIV